MTGLRFGSATDVGRVRRNNQDNLLAEGALFAVADGMGGHVGGEVASHVAIEALHAAFGEGGDRPRSAEDLVRAVQAANTAIHQRALIDAGLRGMGTTLAAAALVVDHDETRLAVANVGDSRTYVFTGGELTQLSEDHSVAEELVRQGQLDPDEVDTHPQRHILTRALGISADVDVDLWEVIPYAGDRLLLCSDGLVREVTDDQISSVLRRLADPTEAAQELVARARAAGGSDNITVVVIDVVDDDDLARSASRALSPEPHESVEQGNMAPRHPATFPVVPPAATPPPRRRVTLRVVLFVVLLIGVVGAAGAAVGVYARGSYFVALGAAGSGTRGPLSGPPAQPLVIFQGRPGGLLWFQPTVADRTQVLSSQVLPSRLDGLRSGHVESSLGAARTYVANLLNEAADAGAASVTTTTTTIGPATTTTAARVPVAP